MLERGWVAKPKIWDWFRGQSVISFRRSMRRRRFWNKVKENVFDWYVGALNNDSVSVSCYNWKSASGNGGKFMLLFNLCFINKHHISEQVLGHVGGKAAHQSVKWTELLTLKVVCLYMYLQLVIAFGSTALQVCEFRVWFDRVQSTISAYLASCQCGAKWHQFAQLLLFKYLQGRQGSLWYYSHTLH